MHVADDRLKAALDERQKLTRSYRASKRAQFERAYKEETRLSSFAVEIRRCKIDDADLMISLVQAHYDLWLRAASAEIRALALEVVSRQIVRIREKAGLPTFDDPIFDEEHDVFQTIKAILT